MCRGWFSTGPGKLLATHFSRSPGFLVVESTTEISSSMRSLTVHQPKCFDHPRYVLHHGQIGFELLVDVPLAVPGLQIVCMPCSRSQDLQKQFSWQSDTSDCCGVLVIVYADEYFRSGEPSLVDWKHDACCACSELHGRVISGDVPKFGVQ